MGALSLEFKFRLGRRSEYALLGGNSSLAGSGLASVFGPQQCYYCEMFPGMIHGEVGTIKQFSFCWYISKGENICDELSLSNL